MARFSIRDDVLRETEKRTISVFFYVFKIQLTQNTHRRFGGGGGGGGGVVISYAKSKLLVVFKYCVFVRVYLYRIHRNHPDSYLFRIQAIN